LRKWLKGIRRDKGLTQEEFAKTLGIPVTTYAGYEQGNRTPSVRQAARLADELNVSWTIFFETKVRDTRTDEEVTS
jgi:transcriptional regulator with XRE-family HTH domain